MCAPCYIYVSSRHSVLYGLYFVCVYYCLNANADVFINGVRSNIDMVSWSPKQLRRRLTLAHRERWSTHVLKGIHLCDVLSIYIYIVCCADECGFLFWKHFISQKNDVICSSILYGLNFGRFGWLNHYSIFVISNYSFFLQLEKYISEEHWHTNWSKLF